MLDTNDNHDLQTLIDLKKPVFPVRTFYPDYDGFNQYKKATRTLTVGKCWTTRDPQKGYQVGSEIMKETLIKGAKKSIRMSQQDLISAWKENWKDHHASIWIIEALLVNPELEVQIVVSLLNASAGIQGDQYSFGSGSQHTYDLFKYYITHDVKTDALLPDPDGKRAQALQRLTIAPFYFTDQVPAANTVEGDSYAWPDQMESQKTATLRQESLAKKTASSRYYLEPTDGIDSSKWNCVSKSICGPGKS